MSGSETHSPKFKNLCHKYKQSPKELKDKMRKNYKDKVKNCRDLLLDRFRGPIEERELCNTLTEIYKSMFKSDGQIETDEIEVLEELKNELVAEELEWWVQEYEKSQLENVDWSTIENDDSVICPVCQKSNFNVSSSVITCTICKFKINTQSTLHDVKESIIKSVERHGAACTHNPQFNVIPELNEDHIYLICDNCTTVTMVL